MSSGGEATPTIGMWTCTALVVGNMIGSGFFLSPTVLAPYGTIAILGWIATGAAAVCLGLVFARLARIAPATGGPYAFARTGFGGLAGFLVAWAYWISIWASLPAVALGFSGYLSVFVPLVRESRPIFILTALAAMWLVALINMMGVKESGRFQVVTTALKIVPFLAVSTLGLLWLQPANLQPINPGAQGVFQIVALVAPVTMFAFLGIESATVPAGHVDSPRRTIPRATVVGVLVCLFVYVFGTLAVMGVLPREALMKSSSPFADAATAMWGGWAGNAVAIAVIISSIGALNGWTLMMSQVPMAAGRDGLFPTVFSRLNDRGVPQWGIILSVGLASALLLIQTSGVGALTTVYRYIIDLSTTAAMIPYVFCSLVEAALVTAVVKSAEREGIYIGPFRLVAIVAFAFSLFTVYSAGDRAGLWCLLLLLASLPFYLAVRGSPEAREYRSIAEPGARISREITT